MEYKNTLNYTVEYNGESISVTAKVVGYNELHEWVKRYKEDKEGLRSDDDILAKIVSVDLTQDGKPLDVSNLKDLDLRLVRAINQGYLVASGISEPKADAEKKDLPSE